MTNPYPCPVCKAESDHEPNCRYRDRVIVSRELVLAWAEKADWRDYQNRSVADWPGRLPRDLVTAFHQVHPGLLYPR